MVSNGGCHGGSSNNCVPHHVWSSSPGDACYWYRWLDSGQFGVNNCNPVTNAHSVRCVLDLNCSNTDKLQLCEWGESSSYGAAQCYKLVGGCQGASIGTDYAGWCYPYSLWSSTSVDSDSYHRVYEFSGGSFFYNSGSCGTGMYGKCIAYWALSVRCVLGLRYLAADSLRALRCQCKFCSRCCAVRLVGWRLSGRSFRYGMG